jgi:hypothetical protein
LIVAGRDGERFEHLHGDLVIGEAGRADGGQIDVAAGQLANGLFPRDDSGASRRQQRSVDVPEETRHAI